MTTRWVIVSSDIPYPPNTGGRADVFYKIEYLVREKKCVVDLICTPNNYPTPAQIGPLGQLVNQLFIIPRNLNPLSILTSCRPFQWVSRDPCLKQIEAIGNAILKSGGPRATKIIAEGLYVASIALELAQHLSVDKVIYRMHNLESVYFKELGKSAALWKKPYYFFESKKLATVEYETINCFQSVWALSLNEMVDIVKDIRGEVIWLPPFVKKLPTTGLLPQSSIVEKRSRSKKIVLYVGALFMPNNIYGITWFVRNVWAKSPTLLREAELWIVGREPSTHVRTLCSKYGVKLFPDVPDVTLFYDKADVVINPIFHGAGVNVKSLEALYHGRCLLTTSKGIRGLNIKSGEHVLVANLPFEWKDVLEWAILHEEDCQIIANAGFKLVTEEYEKKRREIIEQAMASEK